MKLLALCLVAIALVFRALPLCASPATAHAGAAMTDCVGATGHHDNEQGHKSADAARVCHVCAFASVANAVFEHLPPPTAVPDIEAVTRFTGRLAEPPTPPPRLES